MPYVTRLKVVGIKKVEIHRSVEAVWSTKFSMANRKYTE